MEDNWKTAAQNGEINMLYTLLREDAYILDRIDAVPFIDTPLHIAASFCQVLFAKELMRLKPSFARKLNQDWFSPMHLALSNGQTQMVLGFLDTESNLVRVQGRESRTPLHYVAEQGDVDLLVKFLSACPQSIQDVTVKNETALHIAVKNRKVDALDFLLGVLRRAYYEGSDIQERKIINWKDDEGNTVLHVAAATDQPRAVRLLINSKINVNVKNSKGLTALDISDPNSRQVRETLLNGGALNAQSLPQVSNNSKDHLRSNLSLKEELVVSVTRIKKNTSNETRNVLLVVAALIATVTYQAALTPPGGVWHDSCNSALNITLVNDNNAEGSSEALQPGTVRLLMLSFVFYFSLKSFMHFTTTVVIIFLLPDDRISWLLYIPLCSLTYCSFFSWLFISPNMAIYVTVVFVLIYLVPTSWFFLYYFHSVKVYLKRKLIL